MHISSQSAGKIIKLPFFSGIYKTNFTSIIPRPHGEVQPDCAIAILFYQQFIKLLMPVATDI